MRPLDTSWLLVLLLGVNSWTAAASEKNCKDLIQLLMLPKLRLPDDRQGTGAFAQSAIENLNDRGVTFEYHQFLNGSFEFKIFPDKVTPLGMLATELQNRGLELSLSSLASSQQDAWIGYDQTFRVQMPLELMTLAGGEANVLLRVIEETYDLQETRVLMTALYNPSSLIKRPLTEDSAVAGYYAPVALTQKTRQLIRRQRRYKDMGKDGESELAHLRYVGELLRELRADDNNTNLHHEFARAMKGYLESTGLPVRVEKNGDRVTYDLILDPINLKEWNRLYSSLEVSEKFPYHLTGKYPELLELASELARHGRQMAWSTHDWTSIGNAWHLTPFAHQETSQSSSKILYLPIDEALRERPTYLTRVLAKQEIKAPENIQITFGDGKDSQKLLVTLSLGRDIVVEARKSLRNLMALRTSFLPKDLHAIYRRLVEDLETALFVFGLRRNAMQEIRLPLNAMDWVIAKKQNDEVTILVRDLHGALRQLNISDSTLFKILPEKIDIHNEILKEYVLTLLQNLKIDIDRFDEEVNLARQVIEETKIEMNRVPERQPLVYPGTFDWARQNQTKNMLPVAAVP